MLNSKRIHRATRLGLEKRLPTPLDVWLDDAAQVGLSGLDNDTGHIDFVRWGAVDEIDGSSSGSMALDDFASGRSFRIGPERLLWWPTRRSHRKQEALSRPRHSGSRDQLAQLSGEEIRGARRSPA